MSRLPHNINTDELLQALETAEEVTTEIEWKTDVPLFLSKYLIEPGEFKVPLKLLYKLYFVYSIEPLTKVKFCLELQNYIQSDGNGTYEISLSATEIMKILKIDIEKRAGSVTTSLAIKTHYEKFLKKKNITVGTKWIKSSELFEIYRVYCIDNKLSSRISWMNFVLLTKLYFKFRRIGSSKSHWFGVNEETLGILSVEEKERSKKNERRFTESHKAAIQKSVNKLYKKSKGVKLKRSDKNDRKKEKK